MNAVSVIEEAQRLRLIRIAQAASLPVRKVLHLAHGDCHLLADLPDAACLTYARALLSTADRRAGHVPSDWTQVCACARCGPVWLWADAPRHVLGCPWCFNRVEGLPIPRPNTDSGGTTPGDYRL
ncbi:MAG TPA: hypothetical protein PKD77_12155 [Rudaea sp.]|jgi:hypothetical protein|nr:hypothetical protein [Rudaea sp.]